GPVARTNVLASLALSVIIGAAVGAMGWAASLAVGLPAVSLWVFLLVAVSTGLISGFFLAVITLIIVLQATRRGLDPDNVTGPLLTTFGAVTTLTVHYLVLGVL
ncbi:MAG: magnesium transporter, partial [Candidatus Thermoplasmatota archaeon]|nr:magnesium transporter [Candidatus Thermoplasmatota archaeon]